MFEAKCKKVKQKSALTVGEKVQKTKQGNHEEKEKKPLKALEAGMQVEITEKLNKLTTRKEKKRLNSH